MRTCVTVRSSGDGDVGNGSELVDSNIGDYGQKEVMPVRLLGDVEAPMGAAVNHSIELGQGNHQGDLWLRTRVITTVSQLCIHLRELYRTPVERS